ncbi:MAG TPA: CinA family nicotinamide mononucleotide deamidase-related protein [Chitinophagaceae bacterium]|nr:CinA family nicotinamide mononucleotide deamidase-related protein [Chitinophagaceae bacterium]
MKQITASIITIGDELLIGQTIDTNSAFIAQELNKIGVWVKRRVAVGDNESDIWQALDDEGKITDIIIITGGLGPTADDITKPLLCKYFGGKLILNHEVLAHVTYLFEKVYRRPGPLLEANKKQAEVPDVCTVLHNARGTAPGMMFHKDGKVFFSLPGVPHEMKGLILNEIMPVIKNQFKMPAILHRTAFTVGAGETMLAEMLKEFEPALPASIKLAYLPSYGMVKLRLTTIAVTNEAGEKEIEPYFEKLQELVMEYLVTNKDEGFENVVADILKQKAKTMCTAESCTGGYIAHRITSVPGSSAYFLGSIISYANSVKENLLHVSPHTLSIKGAVSRETVTEMVAGALYKLKTDYALAVSGIMGPGGGSEEKPVGTVWIAAGNKEKTETTRLNLRFDRNRNIEMTATYALNFLRKFILNNP